MFAQLLAPPSFIESHPILVNICCSLTASLVFLFIVLLFFKPKIEISPFITKGPGPRANERIAFTIKIVNRSWFTAYDVRVEMHTMKKIPTPPQNTMNTIATPIKLVYDYLSTLDAYRPRWFQNDDKHCVRFRTLEDLSAILLDDMASIEVRVILRHGLTGLSNVHRQEYSDPSQLELGRFTSGSKFGLLPLPVAN